MTFLLIALVVLLAVSIFRFYRQRTYLNGLTEEQFRERLQQVKENDSNLKELNLNNLEASKPEWMLELIEALDASRKESLASLIKEGNELLSILVASINTARHRDRTNRQSKI